MTADELAAAVGAAAAHELDSAFALAALLYFGWELAYGWCEAAGATECEKEKKAKYLAAHGRLPALMYQ